MKNLTGLKFGRLEVISFSKKEKDRIFWLCKCNCGKEKVIRSDGLTTKHTTSCGCFNKEQVDKARFVHGLSNTPEYHAWESIKSRCLNPKNPYYKNYGARGITICEQWNKSFETFFKDMGSRPSNKYSIDRINNDAGYFKENCRWATKKEQQNNRRCSAKYIFSSKDSH